MLCGKPSLSGFPAGFTFRGTAPLAVAAIEGSDEHFLPYGGANVDIFWSAGNRTIYPIGCFFCTHRKVPFKIKMEVKKMEVKLMLALIFLVTLFGACIIVIVKLQILAKALLRYMKDKGYKLPTDEEIDRYWIEIFIE